MVISSVFEVGTVIDKIHQNHDNFKFYEKNVSELRIVFHHNNIVYNKLIIKFK